MKKCPCRCSAVVCWLFHGEQTWGWWAFYFAAMYGWCAMIVATCKLIGING